MKKILIVLFIVFLKTSAFSQLIVNDPAATGLLGISNSTLTAMEALNTKIQKTLEHAEWAKNLKSMKQVYMLIESTICTHKDLSVLMSMSGGTSNCLFSFQYNMQLVNLNAALDMFSIIITNGMSMSSGDRLLVMSEAIEKFSKAHEEMAKMKHTLERGMSLKTVNERQAKDFKAAYNTPIKF